MDDFGLYFTYGEIVPRSEDPLWRFKEDPNIVGNFWCTDDGGNKTRSITGAGGVIYLPAAVYWDGTAFHAVSTVAP